MGCKDWPVDDPTLDPDGASMQDASELIELADDYPTVEDLGDPYYFDKLREKINRLGLKPDDGHALEDTLGEF